VIPVKAAKNLKLNIRNNKETATKNKKKSNLSQKPIQSIKNH